jgi:hypothetical protein
VIRSLFVIGWVAANVAAAAPSSCLRRILRIAHLASDSFSTESYRQSLSDWQARLNEDHLSIHELRSGLTADSSLESWVALHDIFLPPSELALIETIESLNQKRIPTFSRPAWGKRFREFRRPSPKSVRLKLTQAVFPNVNRVGISAPMRFPKDDAKFLDLVCDNLAALLVIYSVIDLTVSHVPAPFFSAPAGSYEWSYPFQYYVSLHGVEQRAYELAFGFEKSTGQPFSGFKKLRGKGPGPLTAFAMLGWRLVFPVGTQTSWDPQGEVYALYRSERLARHSPEAALSSVQQQVRAPHRWRLQVQYFVDHYRLLWLPSVILGTTATIYIVTESVLSGDWNSFIAVGQRVGGIVSNTERINQIDQEFLENPEFDAASRRVFLDEIDRLKKLKEKEGDPEGAIQKEISSLEGLLK